MEIILKGLPKISLNAWYAGMHWSKRNKMKNTYKLLLNKHRCIFLKSGIYDVSYDFQFKGSPLDASNCVAMVKLIEDVLFEDDKHDIVVRLAMSSRKGKEDKVTITVNDASHTLFG
jgi:hypothetical protein